MNTMNSWVVYLTVLTLFSAYYCVAASSAFDDDGLITYVTLPRHRIIKWNITYHDSDAVAPGYFFVAPYAKLGDHTDTTRWWPCQIGPHIFDQDGELVWAGSCLFENRNPFDFRTTASVDGTSYLTWVVEGEGGDLRDGVVALVFDDQYERLHTLQYRGINVHEFFVYEPTRALGIANRKVRMSLADLGQPDEEEDIKTVGFVDLNFTSGEVLFEWSSEDAITLDESFVTDIPEEHPRTKDYLHANSIDKNENGDYLFSGRHTDTVYLISGQDGRIIWRLGGKKNDFQMDFTFSRQHNARFVSVSSTHMIVSLLNNGADGFSEEKPVSSGMYIQLDLTAMTATLLNRYPRPDGASTWERGSMQTLPNDNVLVSWSKQGYMSEFAHDGRLLMDAIFASDRYSTYRAYKFPWSGRPSTHPTVVASVSGTNGSDMLTNFHVSWNGATDVKFWRFYARATADSDEVEIATIPKQGFETSYIASGYLDWVSVGALDADQHVMKKSEVVRSSPPEYWPEHLEMPVPGTPGLQGTESKPMAGVFAIMFVAGCAIGAAGCAVIFLFPSIRRCMTHHYSGVHAEDEEEEVEPLNPNRD